MVLLMNSGNDACSRPGVYSNSLSFLYCTAKELSLKVQVTFLLIILFALKLSKEMLYTTQRLSPSLFVKETVFVAEVEASKQAYSIKRHEETEK